jgi:DNA-binding protein Fis
MTTFTTDDRQQAETIQGATGAQYEAVDLNQFKKPIEEINKPNIHQLAQQLTQSFTLLINAILELQGEDKQPVSKGEGLHECVDTVLAEADWLMEKLEDAMDSRYAMTDLIAQGVDDGVRDAVENWFSNDFSLEDHVDIYSMVDTAVEDKLDDVVEDKLADVVEEKLNELMQGKNITISFN